MPESSERRWRLIAWLLAATVGILLAHLIAGAERPSLAAILLRPLLAPWLWLLVPIVVWGVVKSARWCALGNWRGLGLIAAITFLWTFLGVSMTRDA